MSNSFISCMIASMAFYDCNNRKMTSSIVISLTLFCIFVAWLYTIISCAGAYLLCSAGVVSKKVCGEV